jgi:hypothetical protein
MEIDGNKRFLRELASPCHGCHGINRFFHGKVRTKGEGVTMEQRFRKRFKLTNVAIVSRVKLSF